MGRSKKDDAYFGDTFLTDALHGIGSLFGGKANTNRVHYTRQQREVMASRSKRGGSTKKSGSKKSTPDIHIHLNGNVTDAGGYGRQMLENDINGGDLRQQFLDQFIGPSPTLPSASEYLAPFDRASSDLAAQYAAARDAISARAAEVPGRIQQNLANQQQLLALQQQASSQAAAQQQAQAAGTSADIQSRAAALGGSAPTLAAQAQLQEQSAGRAADNRAAFMAQMQAIQQQAAANSTSAAATQSSGALGYLDANRLRAQQQIDQSRAQAQMAYNNQSNQMAQQQHAQRLAAVDALTKLEGETSPMKYIMGSLLPSDDLKVAQKAIQAIEDGTSSPEDVLHDLKVNAETYKAKGIDPRAISTAIRKAYVATRREREKLLKQLGGSK